MLPVVRMKAQFWPAHQPTRQVVQGQFIDKGQAARRVLPDLDAAAFVVQRALPVLVPQRDGEAPVHFGGLHESAAWAMHFRPGLRFCQQAVHDGLACRFDLRRFLEVGEVFCWRKPGQPKAVGEEGGLLPPDCPISSVPRVLGVLFRRAEMQESRRQQVPRCRFVHPVFWSRL